MLALEDARNAVEEQLAHLKDQYTVRLKARLRREAHEMVKEDIEIEREGRQQTVDELFPKVLRGGLLISLWSVFEACIKDIAEYVRKEKDLPFGLQELRAGDFLEQTEAFFSRVLSVNAFPDKATRKKLEEIKGLRNALVHHDGNTRELPKALKSKTEAEYLQKGLILCSDLHHQYVIPTTAFAEQSLSTIRAHLEDFAERVYAAIHPVPLEDDA